MQIKSDGRMNFWTNIKILWRWWALAIAGIFLLFATGTSTRLICQRPDPSVISCQLYDTFFGITTRSHNLHLKGAKIESHQLGLRLLLDTKDEPLVAIATRIGGYKHLRNKMILINSFLSTAEENYLITGNLQSPWLFVLISLFMVFVVYKTITHKPPATNTEETHHKIH